MLTDASIYDDNMTLLQAYKNLAKRVKALEENSGGGGSYTLPTASETTKGGIKVGNNLYMDGEFLNAISGGGSSSGKEIIGAGHSLESADINYASYEAYGSLLFGFIDTIYVQSKDFTGAFEFVNTEDSTDIKTVYLKNSSSNDNHPFMIQFSVADEGFIIRSDINDERIYTAKESSIMIPFVKPLMLQLYDTDTQSEASSIGYAEITEVSGGHGYIRPDFSNDGLYYVGSTGGYFTKMTAYIDNSVYEWAGSNAFSNIIARGQGESSGFAQGYFFWQRDITA